MRPTATTAIASLGNLRVLRVMWCSLRDEIALL
jgi:hypothetical protein